MSRDYKLFIRDIVEAIKDIEVFIGAMDYEEFLKDKKTQKAVVWQIHVIGEATKNLPEPIREKYKEVPWKYMAKIRDKIAHFYFGIDYEILWNVVKEKLPEVKSKIEKILTDLNKKYKT
jgi:uncharacterized protein with HEPN domain